MKNQKVSKMQKASYAIGSGAGNVIITLMSTFLTAYYTDTVGMAIAAIGTMMLYVRFLDGISDIIMGAIIEKTNTKWGKARPWMLYSVPLIIASVVLTLNVPERLGDSGKLVYIYLTYILLNCITYTAYQTAHSALLARITLDPNERQSMTSINQIANTVVTLVLAPLSYGPIQVRVSEALTVLPLIWQPSIISLTIGCFLSNLIGVHMVTTGPIDIVVGTLATFLAAVCTFKFRDRKVKGVPLLSLLMPVLFNGVFVGLELAWVLNPDNILTMSVIYGVQVAIGELVAVIIGWLILPMLKRIEAFKE